MFVSRMGCAVQAFGSGLNLTAASHVIHYDLWWNPAVENQATDRAYRIGQKKNVMVHRMITKNTFEERIDEMIQARLHSHDQTRNNYRDSSIMQSYQFDRGLATRLMLAGYIDMLVAESDLNIFKKTSHKLAQLMFDK